MTAEIGSACLTVALLTALYAAGAAIYGARTGRRELITSARRAFYCLAGLVLLSVVLLQAAYIRTDLSFELVARNSSTDTPLFYKLTAMWSSQEGSLLLWALLLSIYSSLVLFATRRKLRDIVPWATGVLAGVTAFFLSLMVVFGQSPFKQLATAPAQGHGLEPLLRHPAMAIHPPMLYSGYVGFAIPFAFAIGALIVRRTDAEWIRATRRFALIAWTFLTCGILLGALWSYSELGWGGYWAWDPVENASLLPWLTGTAFLHSIMIQEKRGMLRKWNVVLVVTTFLLAIFGTFITRSGVIESVHSFAQSPVGTWFATFFFASTGVTIYFVATRLKDLEAKAELESMVSREAAFLYNNLVLVGIAFSVLWGTLFPILSEWVRGSKITVGPPFFNTVNVPLGLLLLGLTGVGPLIAWRKASTSNLKRQFAIPTASGLAVGIMLAVLGMRDGHALIAYTLAGFVAATIGQEFWKGISARRSIHEESLPVATVRLVARNRRRYGGYIVHAGIVVLFSAFAGLAFKKDHDVQMRAGETKELVDPLGHHWKFTSQGVSTSETLNRFVTAVA
ncbi:MAG: cytochrome c-type biosis protein CcmF, partial [Thermoleophilaceae bacterium]|nr:cytochrome c-type biosis protein CcmF [Thermoleophilaceae bacterium]